MQHATPVDDSHGKELASGDRFAFGRNWSRFLRSLDESRIEQAVASLREMLEVVDLHGKTFVDVGSGSGLFSLAARRLGARVHSFDFDPQSVACTSELRRRYFPDDPDWRVEVGSALDGGYLERVGTFDVVYSWGVLHHTGSMWRALANVDGLVKPGGTLFVALYNAQPFASGYWAAVKRLYNKMPLARPLVVAAHVPYPLVAGMLLRLVQRRAYPRGMSPWYDLIDWLGGYPFEVCTPRQVFEFYRERGYSLSALRTVGGRMGCNEFVFRRTKGT